VAELSGATAAFRRTVRHSQSFFFTVHGQYNWDKTFF